MVHNGGAKRHRLNSILAKSKGTKKVVEQRTIQPLRLILGSFNRVESIDLT